mmetsp:Transcript_16907/g.27432  ORF Transcript_16907/g.27432 Transcript_16907/m.27432 type:complete len:157 (+) Transcript_16907:118-588(+)
MASLYKSGIVETPPNGYCYTAVINACAYCEDDAIEKRDALKIFVETYKEVNNRTDLHPNHVFFKTVLTALRKLLPRSEQRKSAVSTVFKKCIECGMCDSSVLRSLESALSKDELTEVLGHEAVAANGRIDNAKIPPEWKRNVKDSSRPAPYTRFKS